MRPPLIEIYYKEKFAQSGNITVTFEKSWYNKILLNSEVGYLPIMPVNARDSTGTGTIMDKQGQAGTSRDKAGTSRDKAGTNRDRQGKTGKFPFCPCLSLLVPVCPCLSMLSFNLNSSILVINITMGSTWFPPIFFVLV